MAWAVLGLSETIWGAGLEDLMTDTKTANSQMAANGTRAQPSNAEPHLLFIHLFFLPKIYQILRRTSKDTIMTLRVPHLESLRTGLCVPEDQPLPHPNPGLWVSKSVLE